MLRLTEIFYSLQGETSRVGLPTVFIRLTGCPLRCTYCDTAYAFHGGQRWALPEIMAEVDKYQTPYVTVTGGEPLAQKECAVLLTALCDAGYDVSLETSGALSISHLDPRVKKILDFKTPDSSEVEKNLYSNVAYLTDNDEVKFVICSRADYEWSKEKLLEYQLDKKCTVLFSPSNEQLSAKTLAEWILEDKLPVRFQIQLHKTLWGNEKGK